MFHLYITLAYIIPNIYVFFRVKNLFISKAQHLKYILVYLLIASIYPIAKNITPTDGNIPLQLLITISDYLLPLALYLFLSVLAYDIFLLFNRFARIVAPETRKSSAFRFYMLSAIIILSVSVVIGGAINLNTIRVSKYELKVPKRNSSIDHLRIAFVADLHLRPNSGQHFVEQFVRKSNALQPDIMLFGGDMILGRRGNEYSEAMVSVFRNIKTKYGTFGVLGNHESYRDQKPDVFFQKAGITLFLDSLVNIENAFYLAGRFDERQGKRKTINDVLVSKVNDLPIILMDHRPNELQEASRTEVDIQFSGHTHNGQLFPINLIMRSIYELPWGYKKIANTHFFVTSGLRLWGPPVKTAGKSEIMLVDVYFE